MCLRLAISRKSASSASHSLVETVSLERSFLKGARFFDLFINDWTTFLDKLKESNLRVKSKPHMDLCTRYTREHWSNDAKDGNSRLKNKPHIGPCTFYTRETWSKWIDKSRVGKAARKDSWRGLRRCKCEVYQ